MGIRTLTALCIAVCIAAVLCVLTPTVNAAGSGKFPAALAGRDKNGDGRLSADELPSAIIERFDANADGAIDPAEAGRIAATIAEKNAKQKEPEKTTYESAISFDLDSDDMLLHEELMVFAGESQRAARATAMHTYLLDQCQKALARRKETYESLKTDIQISVYQQRLKMFFRRQIGEFPERTPLKPEVLGVEQRDGYRFEKVIYQSRPGHYVTAHLYLPDAKEPCPGVLLACGHERSGKAAYQHLGISLAKNGIAALCYDPISQGERGQLPFNIGPNRSSSTYGHMMLTTGSILLGRNAAHYRIWDGMRSLDYLTSRPEIDPKLIGCSGNSGGGTMTAYLMALDDRIAVAAPSCYLTSFERLLATIGPQDAEQNIFGQVAFGMNHADYMIMRAPKPTLMCTATDDFFDIDGAWDTFRQAKRIYTRMGFAERVDFIEADEKHGFTVLLRTGVLRWMRRWLGGIDTPAVEPPIVPLAEEQIRCLPDGEVMNLPGAKSVYDFNIDLEKQLAKKRQKFWQNTDRDKAVAEIRRITGIRPLDKTGGITAGRVATLDRNGYTIEKLVLTPDGRPVAMPALLFKPNEADGGKVLYLHGLGKDIEAGPGGEIIRLVMEGKTVLAVDMPGIGELAPAEKAKWGGMVGPEWKDCFLAYLSGRPMLTLRAEDIGACARLLGSNSAGNNTSGVDLIAVGKIGPPALHAAAVEPDLFASVKVRRSLVSWSQVIGQKLNQGQFSNAVHGALEVYDLPDLAGLVGKDKIEITDPIDAMGQPIRN